MDKTEKSLMPQLSTPVERKLLDIPAKGENGAAVVPNMLHGADIMACRLLGNSMEECLKRYPIF